MLGRRAPGFRVTQTEMNHPGNRRWQNPRSLAGLLVSLLLGVILAAGVAWWFWPESSPGRIAEVSFGVDRVLPDQTLAYREGDACWFETDTSNQLLLMMPDGSVVGWFRPTEGRLAERLDSRTGQPVWICTTVATFEDVPLSEQHRYLIQVNRGAPEMIYDFELGAVPTRSFSWVDAPAYPLAGEQDMGTGGDTG